MCKFDTIALISMGTKLNIIVACRAISVKYSSTFILVAISLFCGLYIAAQGTDQMFLDKLEQHSISEPSHAIAYSDSLLFAREFNQLTKAKILYYRARAFSINKNETVAVEIYSQCLSIFEEAGETQWVVKCLLSAASPNIFMGKYKKATEQVLQAMDLAKSINNSKYLANSLTILSHISFSNGDIDKAISLLEESQKIQIEAMDSLGLSITLNNIAICYKNKREFTKALEYNLKSLDINRAKDKANGVAMSYSNLGSVYMNMKEYDNAIEYLHKSINLNKVSGITNSVSIRNLGKLYAELEAWDSSFYYYNQAMVIDKINQDKRSLLEGYDQLVKNYIEVKQFEDALFCRQKSDSIKSELTIAENLEKISMLESQHNLFNRNQELEKLKTEQKTTRVVLIILVVLSLFVFLYFYQKSRLTASVNEKEKIILEQKILRSQMNPHFIFNVLSAIQNALLQNEPLESASYLSRFAKLIRQNFEFAQKDLISLKNDLETLENYIETQKIRFPRKFEYSIIVDPTINRFDQQIPPLLLQPLVENAIEHGFKDKSTGGEIEIKISKQDSHILFLSVSDNGCGYTPKEDGKKHALSVIRKRLQLINKSKESNLTIESPEKGAGAIVSFWLKTDV